jgi:hypothetical protein
VTSSSLHHGLDKQAPPAAAQRSLTVLPHIQTLAVMAADEQLRWVTEMSVVGEITAETSIAAVAIKLANRIWFLWYRVLLLAAAFAGRERRIIIVIH